MGRSVVCLPLEACMAPSGMTSIDMPKRKGGKPMNWLNKSTNLCELQSQWNDVVISHDCSLKWYFWKIHIMLTTLAVKLEVVVVSSCSVCGKSLLLSPITFANAIELKYKSIYIVSNVFWALRNGHEICHDIQEERIFSYWPVLRFSWWLECD